MKLNRFRVPFYATIVLIGSFSVALSQEEPVCDANEPCEEEPVCEGTCCDLDEDGQGATIVNVEAKPGQALVAQTLVAQNAWVQATSGMYVKHFGHVMCLDNCDKVLIAYDDGCWYELKENEMLTIVDESPCCAAALLPPPASAAQGLVSAGIAAGAATLAVTDVGAGEKTTIESPPEEELPPSVPISP